MDGPVTALAVYRERLIAAGEFSYAGGTAAAGVAEWDGGRWNALGEGLSWRGGIPRVSAMTVYENALIVCGTFDAAGGEPIEDLARWDGTDWTALGSGTDGWISGLTVYQDELIAGGRFDSIGGIGAPSIARWNGEAWHPLESIEEEGGYSIAALGVHGGDLIASTATGSMEWFGPRGIYRWDGLSWSRLGGALEDSSSFWWIGSLTSFEDRLVAGGLFDDLEGRRASCLAAWDGSSWGPIGAGVSSLNSQHGPSVSALASRPGALIVGGTFDHAGSVPAAGLARWDGAAWSGFGEILTPPLGREYASVLAVLCLDDRLYVGGSFRLFADPPCAHIACWRD